MLNACSQSPTISITPQQLGKGYDFKALGDGSKLATKRRKVLALEKGREEAATV
jgi:hypothetical protein